MKPGVMLLVVSIRSIINVEIIFSMMMVDSPEVYRPHQGDLKSISSKNLMEYILINFHWLSVKKKISKFYSIFCSKKPNLVISIFYFFAANIFSIINLRRIECRT